MDTMGFAEENLAEANFARQFDSLTYIIDTLTLSLVKTRAEAQRDYKRYITEAEFKDTTPIVKTVTIPEERDNITYLMDNAKKFADTDCRKSLAFLYAAQKIAQIDGTSSANKESINQMMNKCEDVIFNNQ